jgi:flagellar hook assembly protein FlgD
VRRAALTILLALLATLAMPVAPAIGASSAKVVVIVGPVGSHNAHYKADASDIVAEARRYTSNVVKITTPNATWSKVKAAAQGASVLVYLGHGNGWPSIYAPFQVNTKDGLGLDPGTGADGKRTVYYGEGYIRSGIRLAPNAVVLLFHLCYASGNTEPGLATGSLADSLQRVDNYGAGFIGAGARAVFAEGHPSHPATGYIRQLFTTDRSMDAIFRSAPTWHGNLRGPIASQRTPGLRYELDSDTATPSGFYRSLIGDLSLTANLVTGASLPSTDRHPADFVVPGAAQVVSAAGAGLFTSAKTAADPDATAPKTLARATRLRVTAEADPAPDGTRILAVGVLGTSTAGFVRATDVGPRDSAPTLAWNADESSSALSPNGDGLNDALVVTTRFSETVASTFTVRNAAGTKVKSMKLTDDIARYAWDLRNGAGKVVANGRYTWTLKGKDTWGNAGVTRTGSFVVDSVAPVSKATSTFTAGAGGWAVSPVTFTVTAKDALSGVGSITWRVDGGKARPYSAPVEVGTNGVHRFEYRAVDKAGNRGSWRAVATRIDTRPPAIKVVLSGKAGDAAGTWRGPVTIKRSVSDAASGMATVKVVVDDGATKSFGTGALTVTGDGEHTVKVTATDVAGNRSTSSSTFLIDATAPVVELPRAEASAIAVSPNDDGVGEQASLAYTVSEPASIRAVVTNEAGATVRTLSAPSRGGAGTLTWDGRTAMRKAVPDGRYTVTLTGRDAIGNTGKPVATRLDVYAALSSITRTPSLFYPQDGDKLATKTTASYRLLSPATVSIRVTDTDGALVRSGPTDRALRAGPASWAWNGKRDDGSFAPAGVYRIVVEATNGAQSGSLATTVRTGAFRITTSRPEATRGKAVTVTAVSAETLSTVPRIVVKQPGVSAWTLTMTRVSSTTWKATITPRRSGTAGTMTLTVKATDSRGGANRSVMKMALK